MNYPKSPINWRNIATSGYPNRDEYGPYPTVLIALACKDKPDWGHRVQVGVLWFFGGDPGRPYWTGGSKTDGPVENSSWHVTHWAPYPEIPTN